jgi:hypothetical protein
MYTDMIPLPVDYVLKGPLTGFPKTPGPVVLTFLLFIDQQDA